MLWVDRTLESIISDAIKRMPRNLVTDRAVRRHEKVVDVANGRVVGFARWILPPSHSDGWLEAQIEDVTEKEKKEFDALSASADWSHRDDMPGFDNPLDEMMKKHKPKNPHISEFIHLSYLDGRFLTYICTVPELDYLAVSPDYQHQGIGSRLVQSGIEQANKLGLEIFLVAMGTNALTMYQKYGFELIDQLSQDLRPWGFEDSYDTFILIKQPGLS